MVSYQEISDQELLTLLQERDKGSFNEIYYRYSEKLYRFAFNILRDEDECTDAVQELFIWLWLNVEKLNINDLKGYLHAAIKYKLARIIHNSKRRAEILSAAPDTINFFIDESIEVKELKEAINDFLNTLPARAREVFQLSRGQYLSNKEIAAQLNISEKTVENQLTISLKKLRIFLDKNYLLSIFL